MVGEVTDQTAPPALEVTDPRPIEPEIPAPGPSEPEVEPGLPDTIPGPAPDDPFPGVGPDATPEIQTPSGPEWEPPAGRM